MQYTRRDAQLFFDFLKKIVYSHERYYLATGEMKMKLLIFSDSHRANITDMLALIDEEKPDAVAHLGDLVCDVEDIRFVYPELPVYSVRGNNDWGDDETPDCAGKVWYPAPAGSGLLPSGKILDRLEADGYDGWCVLEHFGARDQLDCMRREAEWLRARRA